MEQLIQIIINALIFGAIYILVAMGFAFVFNLLGVFNIAHGALYMASAYLGYFFIGALGINQWLGLALVIIIMGIIGVFMERVYFRPFMGNFVGQLSIGVAVILVLITTLSITLKGQLYVLPRLVEGAFHIGSYTVTWDRILVFAFAAVILALTMLFVNRTRWGLQMQAITQDRQSAALLGVNINRISAIASGLGLALAGVAGVLMGSMYILTPYMGQNILIKILMLVILAGVGSFGGLFIVGLIMGILYATLPLYLPGNASDAVAVVIVSFILLLRPQGFFGHEA